MTWDELKKQCKGLDRAVLIVKEYMELGSYDKLAKKYGTDRSRIAAWVATHKYQLEKEYPELYAEYRKTSISNKGKTGKREYTEERALWGEVKKQYKGVDRARFVMQEAIRIGGLKNLQRKYSVPANNFSKIICAYKEELERDYPEELEEYRNSGNKRRGAKVKIQHLGKKFRPEVLEMLNKEVYEEKFSKFILNYNTGELSTEQLIKMASNKGIKVYELTNDGNKRFIEG